MLGLVAALGTFGALDANMARSAAGIGGKGQRPVMAGAAVFALIKGFHHKILVLLGLFGLLFKNAVVAHVASQP